MKNTVKTIIFDVDGTLAETEELHRKAFNETFHKVGLDWYWNKSTYKELLKIAGGRERIKSYQSHLSQGDISLCEHDISILHTKKTKTYVRWVKNGALSLRPGIKSMITSAVEKKIKLAAATSTSLVNLVSLTKSCLGKDPNEIFHFLATGDLVKKKKPATELYDLVLKEMSIKSEECLAIEDSRIGMLAAKGANMQTLVSPSAYHLDDDFTESDYFCGSLEKEHLPEELRQLLFL